MKTGIKTALIAVIASVALFFVFRFAFIRTVNYEIGGIKIPSRFNILTGSVRPIKDYRGGEIKKTIEDNRADPQDIGLSSEAVVGARIRWALFEEWVKGKPQYKGWDADRELFKRAQDDFLAEMKSSGRRVTVLT